MAKAEFTKPRKKRFTLKGVLIVLLVGIILGGAGAVWALQTFSFSLPGQNKVETLSPSTVFSRIQDEGELVSVSQDYSIVDKVTSQNQTFLNLFEIPFTQNSFWYRYVGTIKAGVNLKTAELQQDPDEPTKLHVTLDQPYIISNTPDMNESGVLEENNNLLNPISISESDDFQKQCQERGEQEATDNGLLDEARTQAESQITTLFNAAFGEDAYTLDFTYRD